MADGSVGKIDADTTNLAGNIEIAGTLESLTLNNVADNHIISIGAPTSDRDSLDIDLRPVTDLTINSLTLIDSLDFIA